MYAYNQDLSRLGRDLNKVIILDNSPASNIFHPDNAVGCTSWFDDIHDTELLDLIPHFEQLAAVDSVYSILKQPQQSQSSHYQQPMMMMNRAPNVSSSYSANLLHSMYQRHEEDYDEDDDDDRGLNQQVPTVQQPLIYQVQQHNQHPQHQQHQQHQPSSQSNFITNSSVDYSGVTDSNNNNQHASATITTNSKQQQQ